MKREEEGATQQTALSKKEDSAPCADKSYPVTPALPPLGLTITPCSSYRAFSEFVNWEEVAWALHI